MDQGGDIRNIIVVNKHFIYSFLIYYATLSVFQATIIASNDTVMTNYLESIWIKPSCPNLKH
jgi:hypothetical protein